MSWPVAIRELVEGTTEFVTRENVLGSSTPRSESSWLVLFRRPALTEIPATFVSAGRKDFLKVTQSIGVGEGAELAPKETSKEMIERLICAVPENSGPQICRSAPTSNETVCVPKNQNV